MLYESWALNFGDSRAKNMLITLDCIQQVPSFVLHSPPIHTQPLDLTLNDLSAYSEVVAKHIKGIISKTM